MRSGAVLIRKSFSPAPAFASFIAVCYNDAMTEKKNRMFAYIEKNHKKLRETTFEAAGLADACEQMCEEFSLSRPVVLNKHLREFSDFRRVKFALHDFVGEDGFDDVTIELITDKKKKDKCQ